MTQNTNNMSAECAYCHQETSPELETIDTGLCDRHLKALAHLALKKQPKKR